MAGMEQSNCFGTNLNLSVQTNQKLSRTKYFTFGQIHRRQRVSVIFEGSFIKKTHSSKFLKHYFALILGYVCSCMQQLRRDFCFL